MNNPNLHEHLKRPQTHTIIIIIIEIKQEKFQQGFNETMANWAIETTIN
jgi:hypothetical protein